MHTILSKLIMIGFFLVLFSLFGCTRVEKQQQTMDITKAQWQEDIRYYAKHIREGHLNLFHTLSENEFDREMSQLLASVNNLSSVQMTAELIRITQRIGDGHTSVSRINFSAQLPIKVKIYDDKFIITATNNDYKTLQGGQITHIDDISIDDIAKQVTPYTSNVENEWSWRHMVVRSVIRSELLYSLGITSKALKAKLTYIDAKGVTRQQNMSAVNYSDYQQMTWLQAAKNKPAYLTQPKNSSLDGLWYTLLPDNKTVYIRFDKYPSMPEMESFSEELARYIDDQQLSRMVFDFRGNGGGDFYVGIRLSQPLIDLSSIDWLNGVFVVTGRNTFSAAMSNAAQYKQMLNARLIGEPTGADPVGFQELGIFTLPHSKRNVYYSKRIFRFQDENSEGIQPDIYIAPSWEHESAGRDPVIEWLLTH